MSLENEDELTPDQPAEASCKPEKKIKFSYTREFLLSFSELDVCKQLPGEFDQSLLSEFEDALHDRHRISGNLPLHGFRRNEYGSSPPTKGELGNYSRGIHGRWDSRTSGRSDKDSDLQSDWDSDSGKRYGNQSRRSWQSSEHDGLLGSGSFPRPSGYAAGTSAPRFQSNEHYQLSRTNEPYHPPRPYKAAPYSRREANDSYNDETFGSSEYTSEDRAEEERKRRASFELLRKEQHKAFQEKQKLNPEKHKDDFDITELMEDSKDEKGLLNRSNGANEPALLPVSDNDSQKSLPSQTPASRPLVPPGFTSTILERNSVTKTSIQAQTLAAGNSQFEGSLLHAKANHQLNFSSGNREEKQSADQMGMNEQQHESMISFTTANNTKGKSVNISSVFDVSTNKTMSMDDQLYKGPNLSEVTEAPNNGKVEELDAEQLIQKRILGASNQDHAPSILDKLFGSAKTLPGGDSSSLVEHDSKADGTWSPQTVQSSKFAYLFLEEEKKPVDGISSSRPNDLLSLIQGGEKGGSEISDINLTKDFCSEFPIHRSELGNGCLTSNLKYATVENPEQISNSKIAAVPAVLTCEDLEQSILSEISESHPTSSSPMQAWSISDMRTEQTDVDDRASQHLLSLLQKGSGPRDMAQLLRMDNRSSGKPIDMEGAGISTVPPDRKEANVENVVSSGKTLTLETLFGSAFMKELQSVGAPVSARVDVSESHQLSLQVTDDHLLPPTVPVGSNRTSYGNNKLRLSQREQIKSDGFAEHLFRFDDHGTDMDSAQLRSELESKLGGFDGPVDFRLPEEDSLINVGDPVRVQNLMPSRSAVKAEPESVVGIAEKLAAFNSVFKDERSVLGGQEGPPFPRTHDMGEADVPFHNLGVQPSSPQVHSPQLNHVGPMFHSLDPHRANVNSQLNFMASEGIVHLDLPPNHQFPANMIRPPFHHPNAGLTDFDPSPRHPMLQQMHMAGNFPPAHLLQGFPRGAPLPPHSNSQLTGLIHEMNPTQGFPFGHRPPNFPGLGMPPASDVVGRSDHPEALQRLIEMELRANSKQIPPFGAGGHSQGMYGHELDMGFGYR